MNLKKQSLTNLVLSLFCIYGFSQQGFTRLPLTDLNQFKPQAGNWFLVGDVFINPFIDVSNTEIVAIETKSKKRNKNAAESPKAVTFSPGVGILLNFNDNQKKDALLTTWEHGDIELELDIMLPKGSNSGIYFQGRYEIQLLDSYGIRYPKYSDIGGIYRNWEREPGKIYMGKAPLTNAAKAPGLWQHLKINFRAPRFDTAGKKIENAKIIHAALNGVTIHQNVEIPLPTGGSIENNETSSGPIMIQGDHGTVAIKNFRYKLLNEPTVSVSDFKYATYEGDFKVDTDVLAAKPVSEGTVSQLTYEVSKAQNNFGIRYQTEVEIVEKGKYTFKVSCNGSASLKVNNVVLSDDDWSIASGSMELDKGYYPVEIVYYKTDGWLEPKLGLEIFSENSSAKSFHSINSFPPDVNFVSPIYVQVESEPKLIRAFLDFERDRSQRLTHTVAVGEPSKLHYIYNLAAGNIACVWKGDFIDATPMWHERGDGSYIPRGMVQYLSKSSTINSTNTSTFRSFGYTLDDMGRPTFNYEDKGIKVKDKIYPDTGQQHLIREVAFENGSLESQFQLAEGKQIEKGDGSLFVVDKSYYIKIENGDTATIKNGDGVQTLQIPTNASITYSIIW